MANDPEFDLIVSITFALRQKVRPKVAWKSEEHTQAAAKAVIDHLRQCGYDLTPRDPNVRQLHSSNHFLPSGGSESPPDGA